MRIVEFAERLIECGCSLRHDWSIIFSRRPNRPTKQIDDQALFAQEMTVKVPLAENRGAQ